VYESESSDAVALSSIEKDLLAKDEKDTHMGTKIFVGNISFDATEQDLNDLFSGDGRQVDRVSIVTDRETGRPRGFAFVEMGSEADASAAISALDGQELHGRALRVNEAHDKPRGGGGGGRGGRGGYGGGGGRRY
jgi:RNA recognition motif-containing protein